MSNDLITLPPNLLAIFGGNSAVATIGEGITGAHPVITVTTAHRFKLKEGDVETDLGTELNVLVVGINPNKSVTVYGEKYDGKTEPKAPLFSSDNGEPVPTDLLNKVISDSRKWAVLLADNPNGAVYELRVPAASIFRGDTYVDKLTKRGAPVAAIVTKLSFDPKEEYARLVFDPVAFVNDEQAQAISQVAGTPEVTAILGLNRPARRTDTQAEEQVYSPPTAAPAPLAPMPAYAQPAAPVAAAPKRTRKAATPASQPAIPVAPAVSAAPIGQPIFPAAASQPHPASTAAANTVIHPPVAGADLEATIANVLKM